MRARDTQSGTKLTQSAAKRQKVSPTGVKHHSGQALHLKAEHAVAYDGKRQYVSEVMAPAAALTALNNTTMFSFIVENDSAGLVQDAVLRFTIQCASGVGSFMPVPLWFDRIEWYDRHSGQEIGRYHGDFMWWAIQSLPEDVQEVLADPVNFNAKSGKESSQVQLTGSGDIRNYYLPLPHLWLEGFELDLSLLRGDLEIKFYPKGSILQGTAATDIGYDCVPSLTEVRWIAGSEMFSQISRLTHRRSKALATHQHNYVDVQQFTTTGVTINTGEEFTIDLDQFHHESAMLLMCIRQNDANLNAIEYVSMGPRATFDHENVTGRSQLGDGTPLDEVYMRKFVASRVFPHKFVNDNAVYVIPFSNNLRGVWSGKVDGYHEFRGDRERIRIVPDSVGVYAIATITYDAKITDGDLAFEYKGHRTDSIATEAAVGTLDAAVNALPSMIAENLMVTFQGTMESAAAVSYEISDRAGNPIDVKGRGLLNVIPVTAALTGPNADIPPTVTISLKGSQGFGDAGAAPQGGSYQIDVYSVYYRHIQQHNGRLAMRDL